MSLSKYFSSQKFFPLILVDGLCVFFACLIALAFRFDGYIPISYQNSFVRVIPFVILLYCAVNVPFGLYGHLWRYTSAQEVVTVASSVATSTMLLLVAMLDANIGRLLPLSVVIVSGFFTMSAFTVVRYRRRLLTGMISRLQRMVGSPDRQRVLIIGAGEAGQSLAQQIRSCDQQRHYELVGFVDDNPAKLGMRVHGISILGNRDAISRLVTERHVSLIIITIHNISGPTLRELLSVCLGTEARVKMLPDFLGEMDNSKDILPLKDITPADLLGRQPCQIDEAGCRKLIADKVVLVTGAAGSIGSELCRQILNWQPRRLLMLDNNETGLYELALTFKHRHPLDSNGRQFDENVVSIIADIGNRAKMYHVFSAYQPQIVFHAAAYKHVPLMEQQPDEAIRVNILGTKIVSELAAYYATERFVLISSDKAINPSSTMGATKRAGEMLITNMGFVNPPSPLAPGKAKETINGRRQQYMQMSRDVEEQENMGVRERTADGAGGVGGVPPLSPSPHAPNETSDFIVEKWVNGKKAATSIQNPKNISLADSELALPKTLPDQALSAVEVSKIQNHQTLFTAVRFGNVLGSRGSVVPTFTRQIELGGPVTITHPKMTRYFMSISEAVSLVIQAGTLTKGDDIFMLDMGQEIRITDLAHKMIRLRGLRPGKDIAVEYTGIRPGEKLHEELLAPQEERLVTSHPNIYRIQTYNPHFSRATFLEQVSYLIKLSYTQQHDRMIEALKQLVQTDGERRVAGNQSSPVGHRPSMK